MLPFRPAECPHPNLVEKLRRRPGREPRGELIGVATGEAWRFPVVSARLEWETQETGLSLTPQCSPIPRWMVDGRFDRPFDSAFQARLEIFAFRPNDVTYRDAIGISHLMLSACYDLELVEVEWLLWGGFHEAALDDIRAFECWLGTISAMQRQVHQGPSASLRKILATLPGSGTAIDAN